MNLAMVRKIKEVRNFYIVNKLLKKGWVIINIYNQPKTVFILGLMKNN